VSSLQRELIDINQTQTVNKLLKICPENIFALGQAFGQNNYGPDDNKTVYKSNAAYSEQVL